jgi:cytochrome c556
MALKDASAQKETSIKDIMTRAHKGQNAIITILGKELKGDNPNWSDIQKQSKELETLATALAKNQPPKGDRKSWETLTKSYSENVANLKKAADQKDKEAASAAHRKITTSCSSCHKSHRPS